MSSTNTFRRIMRSGFQGFMRNGFVTLASILVMTITLFMIGASLFLGAVLDSTIAQLEEKVDVNVYFTTGASEADILTLQGKLEEFSEVKEVEYVSREEVLQDFRERHEDEDLTLQALEELGENPFGAVLNVQAEDTSQYEMIAEFLEGDEALAASGEEIVESVNFFRNRDVIDKLTQITESTQAFSFFLTLFLVALTVLITYNTIRLAIYTNREEISIMKLVGASNTYVRGPFVVEGVLYGVVSAVVTLIILYPISFIFGDTAERFFVDFNLFSYYINNFAEFFVIIMLSGILLGAVSSYLAVKKHLKI